MEDAQEPMTDAEAEAVLVALGDPLEYLGSHETVNTGQPFGPAGPEHTWYRIEKSGSLFAVKHNGYANDEQPSPQGYATLEEAFAACERHHATGKWE